MNPNFKDYLLGVTKASLCKEIEIIQSLWSGYGKISRYKLEGTFVSSVVVKEITLKQVNKHPRGWNTNAGHRRKVQSYAVETHWYESWSKYCNEDCRIPKFIGSYSEGENQWIVLEDLNEHFPLKILELNLVEVRTCLKWLACFHATFMGQKPNGLWEIGTYWYLNTRKEEWEKIKYEDLKSKAHLIDNSLNLCQYKTIVHGDAKLANFCFSEDGRQVAAVDFQYVGGGCGMKDVAYFLGSCLSSEELEKNEELLLNFYFQELKKALLAISGKMDFALLEKEWRDMYPFACTDFTRFLLGWMPSHQKVNEYSLKKTKHVLSKL